MTGHGPDRLVEDAFLKTTAKVSDKIMTVAWVLFSAYIFVLLREIVCLALKLHQLYVQQQELIALDALMEALNHLNPQGANVAIIHGHIHVDHGPAAGDSVFF